MKHKTDPSSNNNPVGDKRCAGILMHLTSLPGSYAIGDMGPEARRFAEFLEKSGQRYWQLLPINPVEREKAYSPYSSVSSIAGNTLLISPDDLVADGWLNDKEVMRYRVRSTDKVDYAKAEEIKHDLNEIAFNRFRKSRSQKARKSFESFIRQERNWLHDYALYTELKRAHNGLPWNQWPTEFRLRDKAALTRFEKEFKESLLQTKWLQYQFFRQWRALRSFCNGKDIRLFGDLPFYVSHDSADVWASREIFDLDRNGEAREIAGVPPDYFNEDGQLWGMPVFNWKVLKKNNYDWWVTRLKKNIALFDVVRLDHFRAFADYWSVPANERTARNGKWKPGPGEDFFNVVKQEIGSLPFVAEDLGDINEKVFNLRDSFGFPGMKVLQFAFSDNVGTSDYIPHNYTRNFVVYTGTHDNNTTLGWFEKDISDVERSNLNEYFGIDVNVGNINTLFIRLAYASVAQAALVPMQDILGLDASARTNAPATTKDNWLWRMRSNAISNKLAHWMQRQTRLFNR